MNVKNLLFSATPRASVWDGCITFHYQTLSDPPSEFTGTLLQTTDPIDPGDGNSPFAQYAGFGEATLLTNDTLTLTLDALYDGGAVLGGFQVLAAGQFMPQGIPYGWFDFYGIPIDDLGDDDLDLVSAWKEFVAGTDPTSGASFLHVIDEQKAGEEFAITWLGGATGYQGNWSILESKTIPRNPNARAPGFMQTESWQGKLCSTSPVRNTPPEAGDMPEAIRSGQPLNEMKRSELVMLLLGVLLLPSMGQAAFRYADEVSTTGGQFSTSYPPTNLVNNGFTSPTNTIDTRVNYVAAGNNYATASGTTASFDLTFDFNQPADLSAMHVWNYVYRNGTGGSGSVNAGVNGYTLTFHSGANGTGGVISNFAGTLAPAAWDALNPAQTVPFGLTNTGVRSVVLHVSSNHGAASFGGMNELAFEAHDTAVPPAIVSFAASTNLVTPGSEATLSWEVGAVTNLTLDNGIGSVLLQTANGVGSMEVSPTSGFITYTLTANGVDSSSVSLVGLPAREKVHLYLLIGQSNMQGAGTPFVPALDGPDPRVLQFGSRNGMEPLWVQAQHPLTSLTGGGNAIGMGLEFAKAMLASNSVPDAVICLINHAIGSSAIQWWAPGVVDNKQINPVTGLNYYLYDEAIQRVNDALGFGVLKGVLWHQGEYNSNNNTNPDSDPDGYASRLQSLADNLRNSFGNPPLPFICGKFVPASWVDGGGVTNYFTGLPYRATVEAALADLPNQRNNTFCVDNDGLRGRSDQLIHFDSYSQRLLGQRYAVAMADFYADPYRLYLGGYLSPAQLNDSQFTDPLADNDHDGEPNFMEYAYKTRPNDPADVEHLRGTLYETNVLGTSVVYPAVTFRERVDTEAPTYVVEVSSDLLAWRSNQPGESPETITVQPATLNPDETQTVVVRSPLALQAWDAPLFMRLRVTQP